MASWDDVPHLSPEVKAELWASIPPYQRESRSKGVPSLGSGAIYPIAESELVVADFPIPDHWPRCFGQDVGWNWTSAVWLALDRETGTLYAYSEYMRGAAEPVIHAEAIKSRGLWIPGAIDPASRGRSQVDGQQLIQMYRDLGLDLTEADNAVETGLYDVWQLFSAGRLKLFRSLGKLLAEIRMYRRDDKGRVVKENDHLCDALRYAVRTGRDIAKTKPKPKDTHGWTPGGGVFGNSGGWMG